MANSCCSSTQEVACFSNNMGQDCVISMLEYFKLDAPPAPQNPKTKDECGNNRMYLSCEEVVAKDARYAKS